MHAPCTTAIVGFGTASISAQTSPIARRGWPPSPIAAPAEKCLPAAAQHDDPHRAVAAEPLEAVGERVEHRGVVAVGAVRPVERERRDAAIRDRLEQRVHGFTPPRALRGQRQFGEPADMGDLVAVLRGERHRALVVDADVVLVGVADGAVQLQRGAHGFQRALRRAAP